MAMAKGQGSAATAFGRLFREKRIAGGLTLRSFCERFDYDPAYISRVERGLLPPPEDKEKLRAFARALGVRKESSEWVEFFDAAFLSKGKVPPDLLSQPEASKHLPLLFRTARGKRLSKKKLQELVKVLSEP